MASAPTDYLEALDSFLTCFICQSSFNSTSRRPLALFCGHTFCSGCVPNFKKVFGQLNCPIDHINEVRPAEAVPVNDLVMGCARKVELMCLFHPAKAGDYYNLDDLEPFCEECKPRFEAKNTKEVKDLGILSNFLLTKLQSILATPGLQQRCAAFPNVNGKLQTYASLTNNEKQRFLFNLQNILRNLDPEAPRSPPPPPIIAGPVFTHFRQLPDSSWEIDRFNRILPQGSITPESKQWWISNTGKQVDAVIVMVNKPILLHGIGLAKEVAGTGKIAFVDVLKGTSTQSPVVLHDFVNTDYSGSDPRIQTLKFSRSIPINPSDKITIKVKQTGKGLYYGDPSQRNDPLIGPDDLIITFDDPTYAPTDFQNGQNKWAGPIVKLYFSLK